MARGATIVVIVAALVGTSPLSSASLAATKYRFSGAQLKPALLTVAEIGRPFAFQPPDNGATTVSGCARLDADLSSTGPPTTPYAEVNFTAGQTGPFVGEQLVELTAKKLKHNYTDMKVGVRKCKTLTFTEDGPALKFDLTPIKLSSEAAGARLGGSYSGHPINGYLAVQDLPGTELDFLWIQIGSGSSRAASVAFLKAANKAKRVLGKR
jgi:hypothetical protein